MEDSDLDCKMIVFAIKKNEMFCGNWSDNESFTLLVGNGKRKQCCEVDFSGDEINMYYYIAKNEDENDEIEFDVIECEVAGDEEIEAMEATEATEDAAEAAEEACEE